MLALILLTAFPLCASFSHSPWNPVTRTIRGAGRDTSEHAWSWRGQQVRYIAAGLDNTDGPTVVCIHGLFVNADHWRKNLPYLASRGFKVYALDLLGSGYSGKPSPCGDEARAISGENGRDLSVLKDIELGTAFGGVRIADVELRHPLSSCYNFYTWAEQIADFVSEVVRPKDGRAVLITNSIGTISGLQAAIDRSDLFDGLFIVNPNFRELHVAESPSILHPFIRLFQSILREKGKPLFDFLAKPAIVKNILKTPYIDEAAVTDELVEVLLNPLLTSGASDVVFDTLSYSAGPLPEQQLQSPRLRDTVIEVCYGVKDPWTPAARVNALSRFGVRRITQLQNLGHCPHDESPDDVNPLIADFVERVVSGR